MWNLWPSQPSVLSRDHSSSAFSQNLLFPWGSGHVPIWSLTTPHCLCNKTMVTILFTDSITGILLKIFFLYFLLSLLTSVTIPLIPGLLSSLTSLSEFSFCYKTSHLSRSSIFNLAVLRLPWDFQPNKSSFFLFRNLLYLYFQTPCLA